MKKNTKYVITNDHGLGPVYLVWGGGSFRWWTVHKSSATLFRNLEDATRLLRMAGGTLHRVNT